VTIGGGVPLLLGGGCSWYDLKGTLLGSYFNENIHLSDLGQQSWPARF
jgi:hypothetical protein